MKNKKKLVVLAVIGAVSLVAFQNCSPQVQYDQATGNLSDASLSLASESSSKDDSSVDQGSSAEITLPIKLVCTNAVSAMHGNLSLFPGPFKVVVHKLSAAKRVFLFDGWENDHRPNAYNPSQKYQFDFITTVYDTSKEQGIYFLSKEGIPCTEEKLYSLDEIGKKKITLSKCGVPKDSYVFTTISNSYGLYSSLKKGEKEQIDAMQMAVDNKKDIYVLTLVSSDNHMVPMTPFGYVYDTSTPLYASAGASLTDNLADIRKDGRASLFPYLSKIPVSKDNAAKMNSNCDSGYNVDWKIIIPGQPNYNYTRVFIFGS